MENNGFEENRPLEPKNGDLGSFTPEGEDLLPVRDMDRFKDLDIRQIEDRIKKLETQAHTGELSSEDAYDLDDLRIELKLKQQGNTGV